MITETFTLTVRRVESIRELQQLEMGKYVRKIGQVYFQLVPGTMGFIPRVVTDQTNGEWLQSQVNKKLIYVPIEKTIAEVG